MKNLLFLLIPVAILMAVSCNDQHKYVIIKTKYGNMKAKLYNKTPKHRDNFVKLVKKGYYDSLLFHRVIPGFMIQGGDPESKNAKPSERLGQGGPGYTIPPEFDTSLFHKKGALSAARKPDKMNPEQRSSGSQFYIVQGKTYTDVQLNQLERQKKNISFTDKQRELYKTVGCAPHLDGGYTVFGQVVKGLGVIDSIAKQPTDRNDRPKGEVRMEIEMAD
jgi:peptidyl-prolyl cis-trans isomerase B (cyclophilin B)